jgi:hypothetical protein
VKGLLEKIRKPDCLKYEKQYRLFYLVKFKFSLKKGAEQKFRPGPGGQP